MKGRSTEPQALAEVRGLLADSPRRRDLLIEFLHRIQDRYGHLSAAHVVALAAELRLAPAEVYEVATFYHHFDVVKTVLAAEGQVGFWTVRMKPGKPLAFGTFNAPGGRRVPHLGLPGNPVSAMMTFELFGRPALFKMLGRLEHDAGAWQRPTVRAVAVDPIRNTDGRRFYARCHAVQDADGTWRVRLTGPQGSGVLTSMSLANAYAICPEDIDVIAPGETCEVILVDRESPPRQPGVGEA
mgnify:CR=1 FL=1